MADTSFNHESSRTRILDRAPMHDLVILQLKISIAFDPIKLSKEKLNDSWAFIVAFYKYLTQNCEEYQNHNVQEDIKMANFFNPYNTNHIAPMGPK
jgi:hypothetical protein